MIFFTLAVAKPLAPLIPVMYAPIQTPTSGPRAAQMAKMIVATVYSMEER